MSHRFPPGAIPQPKKGLSGAAEALLFVISKYVFVISKYLCNLKVSL